MRPESDLLRRFSLLSFIICLTIFSVFAQDSYSDAATAQSKLSHAHHMLSDAAQSDNDLYMLRAQVSAHRAVVAPHFPVRTDDPAMTPDEARSQDLINMNSWLENYPGEVFSYVQYVYTVIADYKKGIANQEQNPKK